MKIPEVKDLAVHAGVVRAVENVSFDLYKGETLAIVGEAGSGRGVTTRAVTRLVAPPGKVVSGIEEELDLLKLPEEELRKIGGSELAFQDPSSALDPLLADIRC